jgi:Protein of unknown function (DUF3800)
VTVEIACDESGCEGDHLIGAVTEAFAYGSVHIDTADAAETIRRIRAEIGSPAVEYKSNHLLRSRSRPTLRWFLGPHGPVHGRARVCLVDKALFVAIRIVELLVTGVADTARLGVGVDLAAVETGAALHRDALATWGPETWHALLDAFNAWIRRRSRPELSGGPGQFFAMVDALRSTGAGDSARKVLDAIWDARDRAGAIVTGLLDEPELLSPFDPLIPALASTVSYWGAGGRPVAVVHDWQGILTPVRMGTVERLLGGRLVRMTFVNSRSDPRVQIADYLAGIAGRVSCHRLRGRRDPEIEALLEPYLGPLLLWNGSWLGTGPARLGAGGSS